MRAWRNDGIIHGGVLEYFKLIELFGELNVVLFEESEGDIDKAREFLIQMQQDLDKNFDRLWAIAEAKQIPDAGLICRQCGNTYESYRDDLSQKESRLCTLSHSYCRQCAVQILEGQKVNCAVCNKPYFPDEVQSFGRNRAMALCDKCYESKKIKRLSANLVFQRHRGTGDLSLSDYLETLLDFNFRCAYCLENEAQCIEHFIPISKGGITSLQNCVPACNSCNRNKHNRHPLLDPLPNISGEAVRRVQQYLMAKGAVYEGSYSCTTD